MDWGSVNDTPKKIPIKIQCTQKNYEVKSNSQTGGLSDFTTKRKALIHTICMPKMV